MNNFPACSSCKWLNHGYGEGFQCDSKYLEAGYEAIHMKDPDKFFCSEHTTKDGVKWVNWGEK